MQAQRIREDEHTTLHFDGDTRKSFAFVKQYSIELQIKHLDWTITKNHGREPRLPNLPDFRIPNRSYEQTQQPFVRSPQPLPEIHFRPMFPDESRAPTNFQDPSTLASRWDEIGASSRSPVRSNAEEDSGGRRASNSSSSGARNSTSANSNTSAGTRTASSRARTSREPYVPYDGRFGNWPYYTPMDFNRLTTFQIEEEKFFNGQMKKYQEDMEKYERYTNTALGIFRKALAPPVCSKLRLQLENTTLTAEKRLQAALTQFRVVYCTTSIKFENCAMIDQDIDRIAPATRYDQAGSVMDRLENLFEERELMDLPFDEFTKSQKLFSRLQGPDFMAFVVIHSKSSVTFAEVCTDLRSVCARVKTSQSAAYEAHGAKATSAEGEDNTEVKRLQEEVEKLKRRISNRDEGRHWQGGRGRFADRADPRGRDRYYERERRDGQRKPLSRQFDRDEPEYTRGQQYAMEQKRLRTGSRKPHGPSARVNKATTRDNDFSDEEQEEQDQEGGNYDSDLDDY